MFGKRISLQAAFAALLVMVASCDKQNPDNNQPGPDNGFNAGFGYVGGFTSENSSFETDWATQKTIQQVTDHYFENDREITTKIEVPLPWA